MIIVRKVIISVLGSLLINVVSGEVAFYYVVRYVGTSTGFGAF